MDNLYTFYLNTRYFLAGCYLWAVDGQLQKCRPRQRSISVQYLRKLFHFFRQGISRDVVPQEEVVASCLSWLYDKDFVFFGPIEKSLTDFRLDVASGFALIPSKLVVYPR